MFEGFIKLVTYEIGLPLQSEIDSAISSTTSGTTSKYTVQFITESADNPVYT